MTDHAVRVLTALAAAAVGRVSAERLELVLDGIAPDRFVDEDGQVDQARVASFVDRYAETPAARVPDLGQGRRPGQLPVGRALGVAEAERRFGPERPGAFSRALPAPGQY